MTRLHLVALPHTETTAEYGHDGHTALVRRFARMLHHRGHEIIVYGGERNDADCIEHVQLVSRREQARWFRGYDDLTEFAALPGAWDPQSEWWQKMNTRAAAQIVDRSQSGDLLALIGGHAQQPIAQALPNLRTVEYAVGYVGAFADHRCYPTNAWRHYIHGRQSIADDQMAHGRFYDTVIPHPFDPADFHLVDRKDDYLLYLGRLKAEKGIEIAVATAARTGRTLVVAGQGDPALCPDADYRGVVTTEERAKLLAHAYATLMPTLYMEPFGNVAVESVLSGTPVISTDFGSFPEVVHDGVGARCNTLAEFTAAVDRVGELDPASIRSDGISRFSCDAIAPRYEAWFERLATLDHEGWYTE